MGSRFLEKPVKFSANLKVFENHPNIGSETLQNLKLFMAKTWPSLPKLLRRDIKDFQDKPRHRMERVSVLAAQPIVQAVSELNSTRQWFDQEVRMGLRENVEAMLLLSAYFLE
jgi:hypothetical protein